MDIAEDQLGNLWLATEGGLCKFNGVEFATYKKQQGLSSNQVYCLAVDHGKIWMGTGSGISSYDGWQFQNYKVPSLSQDHWVNNLKSDRNGNIWFSTTSGATAFISNSTGTPVFNALPEPIPGKVSGFAEKEGVIWIATYRDGIYRYADDQLESLPLADELEKATITTIHAGDHGEILLGTDMGLYTWKEGAFELLNSFHVDTTGFSIYSISEEKPGTIWLGTSRGAFKLGDESFSVVNAADGLTDNVVYKIHQDREGTLWFGTFGGGLYKSLGELFTKIGKKQGVSCDYISSICRDSNQDYWFGSYGGGIYQLTMPSSPADAISVKNFDYELGLTNDFIHSLVPDDHQNLWIATASGLNKFSDGSVKGFYKEQGLPANQIFALIKCRDGSLYCGTSMGLSQIVQENGVRFRNFFYPGNKAHNQIRSLLETHSGKLLLGTLGGLKVFDGQTIKDYFQDDSLKNLPVSTLHEDKDGNIWSAIVDNGVLGYNPQTDYMLCITEQQGLSSNIVYNLVMDDQGSLWVGTPHGLDKISFDSSGAIKMIRHFGAQEGFSGVETNANAVFKEFDGSIWFGTVEGAFKYSPHLDQINSLEPLTHITGVRLFSDTIRWDRQAEKDGNLKLAYDQNHLTFDFFGTSLKSPDKVRYKFRLQNFDQDWQPATSRNEAVYTNLPPGRYAFQVIASNNDGVWNDQPASLSFMITPPFWRNWWFFLTGVLVLGVAGRLYYKSRVQTKLNALMQIEKIKNKETIKVRRQVAEDFHDQVGNQLASITVLVQLIQAKLASGNRDVEELLQKLGQFTKMLFTGTRDFIWSIDPRSDRINEMLIYIRDFGEELFEYSDINFHVETNDSFSADAELPIGWSRHIVHIFKEALSNSLRHTGCKNVYLNFNVTDHNYVFELKDDGERLNGYSEDDFLGMGFKNMKERAQKIGGEIAISSNGNAGTRIVLEGKIPQIEG